MDPRGLPQRSVTFDVHINTDLHRKTAVLVSRFLQVFNILRLVICPSHLEFFKSSFSLFSLFSLFSFFVTYQLSLWAKIANFNFRQPKKVEICDFDPETELVGHKKKLKRLKRLKSLNDDLKNSR